MSHRDADRIGLPVRDFLYTLDQVAALLNITQESLMNSLLHYDGRSVGPRPVARMIARDISGPDATRPDWRVTEREFVRWLKHKGYRYHTRGYIS